jgi:hypothetical protein
MLSNVKLSNDFWAETINTACYLINHSPSTTIECKLLMGHGLVLLLIIQI